ncbi:MAG: DUF3473 domain-containing protein [Deltaproteobacteria bacterium]|nr:DUF3473 domain-containing protein [Deltaproteobacteria bacterium]
MINALSVDVEEYFQVSAFDQVIDRRRWPALESRLANPLHRILDLFDRYKTNATFFVLGWIAERHPALIGEIHARGHEIASHGYEHRLIYESSPNHFAGDLERSRKTLEDITGHGILGYRAPSYSITRENMWAFDALIEQGFVYDSSIFPIHHDRYGISGSPRFPYTIRRKNGRILEFPLSTARIMGGNIPVAGGGYLRLFPFPLIRWGLRHINRKEKEPFILYFHPWEIDPEQPRQAVNAVTRFRHYHNLNRMEGKIEHLLQEFTFTSVSGLLKVLFSHDYTETTGTAT